MAMTLASVNREGPKLVSVVVTAIGKTGSAKACVCDRHKIHKWASDPMVVKLLNV